MWFLILALSSLLAVILLILNGYQFSNVGDPTPLLAWRNTPSQQGVRGVISQARDRIPDQTRELVRAKSKHPTSYQNVRKPDLNYAEKYAVVSNTFHLTPDRHQANSAEHSRNHKEDDENEDDLEYDEAQILQKDDKYPNLEESDANSEVLIDDFWVAESQTGETLPQHHLDNASKMAFNQTTGTLKRISSEIMVGRHRTAAILKEDVVLEPMAKYTNMPPVSEIEFLQLKADGVLRRNISITLFNMAPEVFLKTPLTFTPQTRSSCWFVNDVMVPPPERMRCLPYFYLMGMPKCGTTDLYAKITRHPSSYYIQQKEPHWWTRRRFGRASLRGLNKTFSYDDYLHHYDGLVKAIYEKGRPERMVAGDGSASTMWYELQPPGVEGRTDYLALPEVFRELQPEVKLIAILREPVQRLYSDYLFFHRKRVSAIDFHNLVLAELSEYTKCSLRRSPRYCASRSLSAQRARLTLGLYSVFLVDWLKVFPRDRILILRLRDWTANCLTLLPKVYAFLELETLSDDFIHWICTKRARNVNLKKKLPMLNATAEILTQFYQPYNEDLAALLKDNSYLWLE